MVEVAPEGVSFPLAESPRLRPVEVFPIEDRLGRRAFVLRDPADRELAPLMIASDEVEALALLDGRRTISDLVSALILRGRTTSESRVRAVLTRVDEAGYLEGQRAEHRYSQRQAAFFARPVRLAVHTGAYAALPELPGFLASGYCDPDGPGGLPAQRSADAAPLRAIIAPHVDLHRGAPTYSWAYKALAEAKPTDIYVILGTCHTPVIGHFAATRKAYDTPLGPVPTDPDFLQLLENHFGRDLYAGEFSHAGEHSIEFQAVYLRSLGLAGPGAGSIVPVLCDSLHSIVPHGRPPSDVPLVADFLNAMRRTLAEDGRSVTFIAAVDLAHVGFRFGDDWRADRPRMATIERADRKMLDHVLLEPNADAYYEQVMHDRDARRICGLTPLYLLTALMQTEQRKGELLRYTQWVDSDLSSSVTFASAVFH
jgi:AmmeMemoRadiSam system protein B